jgi:transposase
MAREKKTIDIKVLETLCNEGKTIAEICNKLNISRRTIYTRAEENCTIRTLLKERVEQYKDKLGDLALNAMEEILQDKKHPSRATVAIFVAKTRLGMVEDKKPPEQEKTKEDHKLEISIIEIPKRE